MSEQVRAPISARTFRPAVALRHSHFVTFEEGRQSSISHQHLLDPDHPMHLHHARTQTGYMMLTAQGMRAAKAAGLELMGLP